MKTLEQMIAELQTGQAALFVKVEDGIDVALDNADGTYSLDARVLNENVQTAHEPALATALDELTKQMAEYNRNR